MTRKLEMIVQKCDECPFRELHIDGYDMRNMRECNHEDGPFYILCLDGKISDDCPLPKEEYKCLEN